MLNTAVLHYIIQYILHLRDYSMKLQIKGNATIAHFISAYLKSKGFAFKHEYTWIVDRHDSLITFNFHCTKIKHILTHIRQFDTCTSEGELTPRDYIKSLSNNEHCCVYDFINREGVNSTVLIFDNEQLYTLLSLRFVETK
jgi:hypothetical protein